MPEHTIDTHAQTPYRELPEPDRRLIEFYLEPEIPLHELARACGLTLPELDEKLADPRIAREIERIARLTRERHAAIQSAHAQAPETQLLTLTRDDSTTPETKRKAATRLLTTRPTEPTSKRDSPVATATVKERVSSEPTKQHRKTPYAAHQHTPPIATAPVRKRDSAMSTPSTPPDPPHAPTHAIATASGSERTPARPATHHFTLTPTHLNSAAGKIFPTPMRATPRAPPQHKTVA